KDINVYGGMENSFLDDKIALRGGIALGSREMRNLSLGTSYNIDNNLRIDYGFKYPLSGIKDIYGTHRLSMNMKFGDITQKAKIYYDKGVDHFEKEEYEQALKLFKKTLDIAPKMERVKEIIREIKELLEERRRIYAELMEKYARAQRKVEEQNLEEAFEEFKEIKEADDLGFAKIEDLQKRAKEQLEKIEDDKSVKIRSLLEAAAANYEEGEYGQAADKYQKVLGISPANGKAIRGRANARKKLKIKNAVRKLEEKYEEGLQKMESKKWEEAMETFKEIIQADVPETDSAEDIQKKAGQKLAKIKAEEDVKLKEYIKQAGQKMDEENYWQAIENYRKALKLDSQNEMAKEGIERAREKIVDKLYSEGRENYLDAEYDKAEEKFEKVLKMDSSHQKARKMLEIIDRER
ncbi:MAG: hypothetical protein ACQEQC_05775, partial [Elusimicrobiota bacterium]